MEKIYRRALIEDAELIAAGVPTGLKDFDQAMPWDYVFRMAANDTKYWDREVKDKVMLHAVNLVGIKDLLLDGTEHNNKKLSFIFVLPRKRSAQYSTRCA